MLHREKEKVRIDEMTEIATVSDITKYNYTREWIKNL